MVGSHGDPGFGPTQETAPAVRLVSRLRFASLRQNAVVEDIDMKAPRGLDKALFQKLVAGEWIERYQNLLIIGPTGLAT